VQNNLVENSLTVGGLKVSLDNPSSDDTSASIKLNAGGFKFLGGKHLVQDPVLGFSALSATANVDWTNDGSGKIIFDIQGAWAEIIFGLSSILLYQERNSIPGLQYSLGDPVWDCSVPSTMYDCIITTSFIDLKKNLTYTPLSVTSFPCTDVVQGYSPNCTIFQITSVGNLESDGSKVIEITLTLASQKVIVGPTINNNQIGPDFGKVDFTISYPWVGANQVGIKDNASVAIVLWAAGKSGVSKVVGGSHNDKSAYLWYTDNTRAAVWSWDGSATITTSNGQSTANAYVVGLSDTSIQAWGGCTEISVNCIWNSVVIGIWKAVLTYVQTLGWTTEVIILSWNGAGANTVFYDPGLGMTDSSTSSGMFLAPTFLYLAWVLVHYFYQ